MDDGVETFLGIRHDRLASTAWPVCSGCEISDLCEFGAAFMATVLETHIEIDERGVPWIAGANIKVIEVALDRIAEGWSPEEIYFQHPHLSMAQIYSALAYYYDHRKHPWVSWVPRFRRERSRR
jgi:uncharacterized protein (DUF433 family)